MGQFVTEIRHLSTGYVPKCRKCDRSLGYIFDTEEEAAEYAESRYGLCAVCLFDRKKDGVFNLKLAGRDAEIIALMKNWTKEEAAVILGVAYTTLHNFIRMRQIPDNFRKKTHKRQSVLCGYEGEILALWRDGLMLKDIADILGVNKNTLASFVTTNMPAVRFAHGGRRSKSGE